MGIAWCRERVEQAQNSKNPVDRILIRCSNAIKPKTTYSRSQDKIADDIVYKGMRSKNFISPPVPVHAVPPRHRKTNWQTCALNVPDGENSKAPIPPPRKKRKRKMNSLEVINTQLQLLQQEGYTNYTGNLLNHEYITQQNPNGKSKDISHPFPNRDYDKEKSAIANEQKRQSRYIKSSENRMCGRIKKDSSSHHPSPYSGNDVRDEKVKNDNRKKTEQKIKVVKNVSTVSLPNYNELVKPVGKVSSDVENSDDKTGNQSGGSKPPRRNSSAISLPGEGSNSILSSLSEATIHRLETYMKRCRSFGSLKPQQLIERLEEFKKAHRSASESEDSWSGLDDWDLGVIEYCDPETVSAPPLRPKSTLPLKQEKKSEEHEKPVFSIGTGEVSRSQTPPPEEVDEKSKMLPEDTKEEFSTTAIFETGDVIPSDWFVNGKELINGDESAQEPMTDTPPPTPETMENNNNHNTEQDNKNENDPPTDQTEATEQTETKDVEKKIEEDPVPVPPRRKSREDQNRKRKRSHSLNPDHYQKLVNLSKYPRSSSISLQRTTSLIEELAKVEPDLKLNPKKVIKDLQEECLSQSLPEDAFEIFITRKKPSLRESLTQFLGFQPEELPPNNENAEEEYAVKKSEENFSTAIADDEASDRKTPPPLPASPPPSLDYPTDLSVVLTSSSNSLVNSSDRNPHIM